MKPAFKKGDKVYYFGDWNRKSTIYVEALEIASYGLKTGTAIQEKDGSMLKCALYPYNDTDKMVLQSECADPIAEALARSRVRKEQIISNYVNAAHHNQQEGSRGYHEAMKANCQEVIDTEPRGEWRHVLISEIK